MIRIIVLNQTRFDSFIKKGILDVRNSERSILTVKENDRIYVQLESDRQIIGPFKKYSNNYPDCYVIDGFLKHYDSNVLFDSGIFDESIFDSLSIQKSSVVHSDTVGSISNNSFLTGFVSRTIKYSTRTNKFHLDVSALPSNIIDYIIKIATECGLSPSIQKNSILINNPSAIPLSILFSNNVCFQRQSDEFMNGYLVGSLTLTVNRRTDVNNLSIDNQSISLNIVSKKPLFYDFLYDSGYLIHYSTPKQIILSPLCYSLQYVNWFRYGCMLDLGDKKELSPESREQTSSDESLIQHMLTDLSRWLFSTSGIDVDKEIDNGLIITAGEIYEIHIITKSELSIIDPINSSHIQLYLFWDCSEIKYAKYDPDCQNALSSDSLIHCTIPGLDHDLISLLNDHINALLTSAGDLNVD